MRHAAAATMRNFDYAAQLFSGQPDKASSRLRPLAPGQLGSAEPPEAFSLVLESGKHFWAAAAAASAFGAAKLCAQISGCVLTVFAWPALSIGRA